MKLEKCGRCGLNQFPIDYGDDWNGCLNCGWCGECGCCECGNPDCGVCKEYHYINP